MSKFDVPGLWPRGSDREPSVMKKRMEAVIRKAQHRTETECAYHPALPEEVKRLAGAYETAFFLIGAAQCRVIGQPEKVADEWASKALRAANTPRTVISAEEDQDEILCTHPGQPRTFARELLNILIQAHLELRGVLVTQSDDPDEAREDREAYEDVLAHLRDAAELLFHVLGLP
jgi:hypothetical protein